MGANHQAITRAEGDIDLRYPEQGLEFTFWADCDQRLGRIKTRRDTATLRGQRLLGSTERQIFRFIESELREAVTRHDGCIHDNEIVQTWIDVDRLDLSFWFEDNRLVFIDWTCAWKDGESPNWARKALRVVPDA